MVLEFLKRWIFSKPAKGSAVLILVLGSVQALKEDVKSLKQDVASKDAEAKQELAWFRKQVTAQASLSREEFKDIKQSLQTMDGRIWAISQQIRTNQAAVDRSPDQAAIIEPNLYVKASPLVSEPGKE
jgi:methyl-accepting chemotaxis protein